MIEKRVKKIVAESLAIDEDEITPESNFKTDLGADSLDITEMRMIFEDQFSVDIYDHTELPTVGDAIDFLKGKDDDKRT